LAQNGNGRNSCSLTTESGEYTLSGIVFIFCITGKNVFSGIEEGAVMKFLHKYPGLSQSFILYTLEIISLMVIWKVMVNY